MPGHVIDFRFCAERLGCPVRHDDRTGEAFASAGAGLDAIVMPAGFGEMVQKSLEMSMLDGPVVASPDRRGLVFLTQPANTSCPHVPPDLGPFGVWLVPAGEPVLLPRSLNGHPAWSWWVPPSPRRSLIIWSTVIGTARRVAALHMAEQAMSGE
jgi:hypothetical protein